VKSPPDQGQPERRGPVTTALTRSRVRLLLESALIVLSVFLAFGLNEWRQARADRALVRTVLVSFGQEIESNLGRLEEFKPRHDRVAANLAAMGEAEVGGRPAFRVLMEANPYPTLIMPPDEAAWETAVSTGALRLLDYQTAAILSRIYSAQRNAVGHTALRLSEIVFSPAMFEPDAGAPTLLSVQVLLSELAAQEAWLIGEYRAALERLRELGVGGASPP
jgi:hypothetical protein